MEQTNHANAKNLQRITQRLGKRPIRVGIFLLCLVLTTGCGWQEPKHFTHEVLNRMTPIKDQGESETCWAYAMLAAIETEHLSWGDSVNLSPYYIEKMMEKETAAPKNKHGMGVTLREGDREYFYQALDKHFPGLKERYIKTFGNAYEVSSPDNAKLMKIFKSVCKDNGIMSDPDECFRYLNDLPDRQISIFDI